MPAADQLPHALYRAEQVRNLDRAAIEGQGIPGLTLMERAGSAAFQLMGRLWPSADDITLLCGIGNNGGDGYVVARLALEKGLKVRVLVVGDPTRMKGDALASAEAYQRAGGEYYRFEGLPRQTDLIIDGVFGTGLEREVAGRWREALEAVNGHTAPVLALDIPSGLHSDTGRIMGEAVRAQATISFIGLKQGMFTGDGPTCCGDIHFDALAVPAVIYSGEILSARRLAGCGSQRRLRPSSGGWRLCGLFRCCASGRGGRGEGRCGAGQHCHSPRSRSPAGCDLPRADVPGRGIGR